VEIASIEPATAAVGSRVDTPWSQCLRSVRIQGTGLGQRLVLSACSRIYRSPKMVAYFAMWGLRQMVICVQADRFSRQISDWELEFQDVRIIAHDGESITDSRPRCHSVCYSLSWPHTRHIRPPRSSHRAGPDPVATQPAGGPPRLVARVAAARREVLSFGEPVTDGRPIDAPRFSDSTRGDGLVLDAHSDRGHGQPQPSGEFLDGDDVGICIVSAHQFHLGEQSGKHERPPESPL